MGGPGPVGDPIEDGLRAWTAGDVEALAAVLDPQVTLRWVEPGPWDCEGRDEVMRLGPQAFPVITLVTVSGDRVIAMQTVRGDAARL